ncbi:Serine/threonine-protein kinase TEL1 [Frankliniella fusca]|uniref:Serine/threonine-protein kinase TEL1 n=1 Tax=Frankliniella fusca TaxID=407009 RepID=A0AAE1GX93_9NEOP|nr:Serine/threonine-protein kinase TEL1 [Frankliniella fusca]
MEFCETLGYHMQCVDMGNQEHHGVQVRAIRSNKPRHRLSLLLLIPSGTGRVEFYVTFEIPFEYLPLPFQIPTGLERLELVNHRVDQYTLLGGTC